MRSALLASILLASSVVAAAPSLVTPRDGANHRLGDDSFFAKLGRLPSARDTESARMHVHLAFVRDRLASLPATQPGLAKRRAEILGYLDEYIAKGITPANTVMPLRTPVFVDDFGNICAVGYLIERTTGSRAIPDRIVASHRFEYLEDIAAAMPDVKQWVENSGFTLDELASIQPGYQEPEVESWVQWSWGKLKDGPVERRVAMTDIITKGTMKRGRMVGTWTNEIRGTVLGKGTFARGNGTWTSFYQSGKKLAQGPIWHNEPNGTWTFFHESGNVAARGLLAGGSRHGAWTFFDDTRVQTPIAKGAFRRGSITGRWNHYDTKGKLLAVSRETVHEEMGGQYLLEVVPGPDKIRHELHRYGGPDNRGLESFFLGTEQLYVHDRYGDTWMFDGHGNRLEHADGTWRAANCHWSAKRKRIAKAGDTSTMHQLLLGDDATTDNAAPCGAAETPVAASRVKALDALLASRTAIRSPSPAFVKELALGRYSGPYRDSIARVGDDDQPLAPGDEDGDGQVTEIEKQAHAEKQAEADATVADLPRVLAAHMGWYIEFPHIDGRFVRVFHTVPGYRIRDWAGDEDDASE